MKFLVRADIVDRLKYFRGELRPYQLEGVTWLTVSKQLGLDTK